MVTAQWILIQDQMVLELFQDKEAVAPAEMVDQERSILRQSFLAALQVV